MMEVQFQDGLVPVVVQDSASGEVLMLAYANEEALRMTQSTGVAHFFSRSRGELWEKGATSGNRLYVQAIVTDCDRDALLYQVYAPGPACHTGKRTCFHNQMEVEGGSEVQRVETDPILTELARVIERRKTQNPDTSYVARLLQGPRSKLLRKIGEEATEVILAAVDGDSEQLVAEVADLWFHSLVVLAREDCHVTDVLQELRARRS